MNCTWSKVVLPTYKYACTWYEDRVELCYIPHAIRFLHFEYTLLVFQFVERDMSFCNFLSLSQTEHNSGICWLIFSTKCRGKFLQCDLTDTHTGRRSFAVSHNCKQRMLELRSRENKKILKRKWWKAKFVREKQCLNSKFINVFER